MSRISVVAVAVLVLVSSWVAAGESRMVTGQVLYVPAYSEIPYGEGKRQLQLATTLTIRNTDRTLPITVKTADYYDARGKLIHSYVEALRTLQPLETFDVVVAESDRRAGVSASFMVEWTSESPVRPPLVETIMVGTAGSQGVSFVGSARVLEETAE
ncbi:MAG: DUF3124 domain-containing protein [Candidatus Latescibacterota bacterium]|nr:MAG: DUF3124 domain-containing protein [Candidatus Latescibacterota bacterium]